MKLTHRRNLQIISERGSTAPPLRELLQEIWASAMRAQRALKSRNINCMTEEELTGWVESEPNMVSLDEEDARSILGRNMGTADSYTDNVNGDSTETARPTLTLELKEKYRESSASELTNSNSDWEKGAQGTMGKGGNWDMDFTSSDEDEGVRLMKSLQPGLNKLPSSMQPPRSKVINQRSMMDLFGWIRQGKMRLTKELWKGLSIVSGK